MGEEILTQDRIKEILHYDPDTGIFTWRVTRKYGRTAKAGAIAGSPDHKGYLRIRICDFNYRAHRLAFIYMTGKPPKDKVDHINLIKWDNRWENLREANESQNAFNTKLSVRNTSGVKGVFWHKVSKKWIASAKLKGKRYHLGSFLDIQKAAAAYQEFARQHHGDYFRAA